MLTQAALAKRWGVDPKTIRDYTAAGMLPTFPHPKSGRVVYFTAAIERLEANSGWLKDVAS